ncbi:hypothetical protein MTR_3g113010 [Medicago truncatula]|uniref:Uncharacterized protein n=1 Tax=Medicago truncatula TaxID=3880 RepID=G7J4N0_MEDTR|nr:hypothetical protein MTR_3g113010 [Medicago truncatula]
MGYLTLTVMGIYRRMVLGGSVQLSGTMTKKFWQHRVGRGCVWFGREVVKREIGERESEKR